MPKDWHYFREQLALLSTENASFTHLFKSGGWILRGMASVIFSLCATLSRLSRMVHTVMVNKKMRAGHRSESVTPGTSQNECVSLLVGEEKTMRMSHG